MNKNGQTAEKTPGAHCNVGAQERKIRIGAGGIAAIAAYFVGPGWARWALGLLATAGVVTGVMRYCPANTVLGINNCR